MPNTPAPEAVSAESVLLPCPFCGDRDDFNPSFSPVQRYAVPGEPEKGYIDAGFLVECDKCSGLGPTAENKAAAAKKWNTRLSAQRAPAVEELREAAERLLARVPAGYPDYAPLADEYTALRAALSRPAAPAGDAGEGK